jgi:hypothetical protein
MNFPELMAAVERQVKERNHEVLVAVLKKEINNVCPWGGLESKRNKIYCALKKSVNRERYLKCLVVERGECVQHAYYRTYYDYDTLIEAKKEHEEVIERIEVLTKQKENVELRLKQVERCRQCIVCRSRNI